MSTADVIKQFAEENASLKQQVKAAKVLFEDTLEMMVKCADTEAELRKYMTKFGCLCGQQDCKDKSVYLKYPEANLQPAYVEAMKDKKEFKFLKQEKVASSAEEEALVGTVTMDQINITETE